MTRRQAGHFRAGGDPGDDKPGLTHIKLGLPPMPRYVVPGMTGPGGLPMISPL